ncbi:AhpC-TSA-domain-containing protein [Aspergillus ellipticus CBS 707.79]|uniref:thioredoxin-dependent peroxiredoxin n=1 Tax=Aspergillus ellipticus CBS 707.79 TaxID=1448320 RepID=A0A319DK42_9EURO|nr:AhpC-TSA-domain-containing protein [Aspergillus ellipticus CBS 707.79]
MVELRKRKAPAQPPNPERRGKRTHLPAAASKSPAQRADDTSHSAPSSLNLKVGATIELDNFGGDFETNDGNKTTLRILTNSSKNGIVIFIYPRASTPGCTKQACLFRDNYETLADKGLSIYGLSADSPKANTTFKMKQRLPFTLLCNPTYTLIAALGLKKSPKGTIRGIVALDKEGKVLLTQAGGPDATIEAARKLAAGLESENSEPASLPAKGSQ